MRSQQDYRNILNELLAVEEGLTEWEIEFLESLNEWMGGFTEKQATKLEDIWNRVLD
jgi:hypothetical protein